MADAELLVRGGEVVTADGVKRLDVLVDDGRIVALEPESPAAASETLDAHGLLVYPGTVDVHVHVNEPGRGHWEGFASASAALAAGGGTTLVDMPLNAHPPTLDRASFEAKRAAAEASCRTDFALWGGLTPGSLPHLAELAALGVVGFKAFMCSSGIADFERADDLTLWRGMRAAADLGLPVAVHAESEELTAALGREGRARGRGSARDYLDSRPLLAELEAIARALLLAEESGCELHIVHVSSARGVALVREARARGVRASCETCPHYLSFSEDDFERLGAPLKCAPPLRSEAERRALWRALERGDIDLVASDHSPSPADGKRGDDLFAVWGGVSGIQSTLAVLLDAQAEGRLTAERVAALTASAPAALLRLAGKGRIAPGADADLTLVDPRASTLLERDDLFDRHRLSPYLGRRFRGRVVRTLCRGQTVFADGRPRPRRGRFVARAAAAPSERTTP